ncbi:16048_t:CDS:2, partial [Dentiscutata heterogama]
QHKFILDKFKSKKKIDELRNFNYTKYPEFWNIKKNRFSKGEYGWKVGIIKEISIEFPGFLIWSDSGTIISQKTLENLPKILKLYNGFISSKSSGTMAKWTHPGVYKYFNDDECIAPRGSSRKNHRQDQAILIYLVTNDRRKSEDKKHIKTKDKKHIKTKDKKHIKTKDKKYIKTKDKKHIKTKDKKHIKAKDKKHIKTKDKKHIKPKKIY